MIHLKKSVLGVISAATALVLVACGGSGEPVTQQSDGGSGDSNSVKVGFSISTMQNPFFVSMKDGVDEGQKSTGAEVLFADAGDDANKQANDILNFISQKVDVAVLNPTDGAAITSSVEALNDAGIPVITVDRTAEGGEVVAHIGTDNVTAGETTARYLFDAMGGQGEVAILEGVPGASSAIDRGIGFENVLKDYPNIDILATQTANYQRDEGLSVAQNLLQAHPNIKAFLSMNDEMALGAIEAIKAAGREGQILTIGIDGGDDAIQAVADGTMLATIAQQSKLMGSKSIEQAVALANGEDIESEQPIDVIPIDKNNVADYQK